MNNCVYIHEGDRETWSQQRIVVRLWRCGAKCDCVRPEIIEVSPDRNLGYPWVINRQIWAGILVINPDDRSLDEARSQLREATERFGLPYGE